MDAQSTKWLIHVPSVRNDRAEAEKGSPPESAQLAMWRGGQMMRTSCAMHLRQVGDAYVMRHTFAAKLVTEDASITHETRHPREGRETRKDEESYWSGNHSAVGSAISGD